MNNSTNINTEGKKEYEDLKVVVLDGNKRKLDVTDKLVKSDNFRRPITEKSKMCMTICDYSNKDKDENGRSITAKFNFTPEEIAEFDLVMKNPGDFKQSFDRIFNAPDKDGLSPVKRLVIERQSKMRYPVHITIENGKAKCNVTSVGMTNFSMETYVCEYKADIRLSYSDARTLFRESTEYIKRMKLIYAMEIRGTMEKVGHTSNSDALSEKKYVDGVNCLYKSISEQFRQQNEYLVKELENIKSDMKTLHEEVMLVK